MHVSTPLSERIAALGKWYHRIDLGGGVFTPGTRDQGITFGIYQRFLPAQLTGLRVLDLGANACGLSVEFAKRGASVLAIENGGGYVQQARLVLSELGLSEKVEIQQADLFDSRQFGEFDIVCYVGLSYHIRYPQLALDMLGWVLKPDGHLLASTQTVAGDALILVNRASRYPRERGELYGWEPTETLFTDMLMQAGFNDVACVSTSPHPGETKGIIAGNRSYFHATGGRRVPLPFISKRINTKSQTAATHRRAQT